MRHLLTIAVLIALAATLSADPDATRADVSYFTPPSLPRAKGNRGTGRYQAVPVLLTGLGCGCSHSS